MSARRLRRRGPIRAARLALLALVLQLLLPLSSLLPFAAAGAQTPFVICTSVGLVLVFPDGSPTEDEGEPTEEEGEDEPHCPICLVKQLAVAALPPPGQVLRPAQGQRLALAPRAPDLPALLATAPPLPARGPPSRG